MSEVQSHLHSERPLVSIITPVYNAARFIRSTIASVQQQTYDNWEMLLIDDASADESLSIIRMEAEADSRLKVVALSENQGAALARNEGIKRARGRFIAFLDGDDQWKSQKLELQVHEMLQNEWAFSFTAYEEIDDSSKIGRVNRVHKSPVTYKDLLKHNDIGCLTVIVDRAQTGDFFMHPIKARQDYVLWLELVKRGYPAYAIPDVLAVYRQSGQSLSSNKLEMAKLNWRVYRQIERLPLWKSIYYFSHYMWNKVKKYSSS